MTPSDMTPSKGSGSSLLLVVVASGVSGLTWEVLWQHHTGLAFGVSSYGTAVTLAAMMAGLGLGGLLAVELERRRRLARPLAAYGVAEVMIGVTAVAVPLALAALSRFDTLVYGLSPALAPPTRLAGTILVLLVPATAMGTTIPILAAHAARVGESIARIYAANLFGAVGGVLATTFLILPALGVTQTSLLTAGVNLGVAWWAISRDEKPREITAETSTETTAETHDAAWPPPGALGLAFLSGCVIFALEVSWFRSLRAAFQATTESFALILAAFLIALTVGGVLADRLAPRYPNRLADVLPFAAGAILLATPAIDAIDRWTHAGSSWIPEALDLATGFERLFWLLAAVAVPVTLLGMIFPWLLSQNASTAGTGRLYAVNTLGAVTGSLVAGFVFLPWIGSTRTSWLAGGTVALAAILARRRPRQLALTSALTALGLLVAVRHDAVARERVQGVSSEVYREVLFVEEGPDSTVWVARDEEAGTLDLVIDGFAASGEAPGANYMQWMGHLPALAVSEIDEALVICFGTGQTANAVRQHDPERLWIVDLNASVFKAAEHFKSNEGVLEDPHVEPTVMDGRAFLRRRTDLRFDLVTLEPMPPNFAGSNHLYSREFYELIGERLAEDGVVAQWVPFHLVAPEHMTAIVRSFQEIFPYTRLWIDPASRTGILVGGLTPWSFAPEKAADVDLPLPREAIDKAFVLDWDALGHLAEDSAEIVTDDNQLLAYGRDRFDRVGEAGSGWVRELDAQNRWIVYQYRDEYRDDED